jgi:murein DD-endopeptidase MepM/ murein hydrolase activator NlpD
MSKKLTLFVFSNTGSPIKQATISKTFLYFASLFITALLIYFGFVIHGYSHLKNLVLDTQDLESRISNQLDVIVNQRKQINIFASEINMLKSNLVELNNFEKKIRVIANIEKAEDQDTLFGVGGSIPEDLDTQLELKKQHTTLLRDMHEQVEQIDLASKNQKEDFESLLKYLEGQRNLLACTPAIRPTRGWTTSRFGYRVSPFTGMREFHKGLDIANRKGTPIVATADGVVSSVAYRGLLGKVITINHGHGMVTRYAHISKATKKRGESVKRGETIATIGNSGRSTGPHLHYEVHLNGVPVNPKKYILN